jgi:hypothetical protein
MGMNCGVPSQVTVVVAVRRSIVDVWGMAASMIASRAAVVPGTKLSAAAMGEVAGMAAKSGDRESGERYLQGPVRAFATNQRPAMSRWYWWVRGSR